MFVGVRCSACAAPLQELDPLHMDPSLCWAVCRIGHCRAVQEQSCRGRRHLWLKGMAGSGDDSGSWRVADSKSRDVTGWMDWPVPQAEASIDEWSRCEEAGGKCLADLRYLASSDSRFLRVQGKQGRRPSWGREEAGKESTPLPPTSPSQGCAANGESDLCPKKPTEDLYRV